MGLDVEVHVGDNGVPKASLAIEDLIELMRAASPARRRDDVGEQSDAIVRISNITGRFGLCSLDPGPVDMQSDAVASDVERLAKSLEEAESLIGRQKDLLDSSAATVESICKVCGVEPGYGVVKDIKRCLSKVESMAALEPAVRKELANLHAAICRSGIVIPPCADETSVTRGMMDIAHALDVRARSSTDIPRARNEPGMSTRDTMVAYMLQLREEVELVMVELAKIDGYVRIDDNGYHVGVQKWSEDFDLGKIQAGEDGEAVQGQ